jgi:hypothetical protein
LKEDMTSIEIRHKMAPKEWFEENWKQTLEWHAKNEQRVAAGVSSDGIFEILSGDAMRAATMALVLDRGDDEARRWFRLLVPYALRWLGAPPVKGALQSTEVQVEVSPAGTIKKVFQRLMNTPAPATGPANDPRATISVGHYSMILTTVGVFGTDAEIATVIACPETRYRRPDEFAYPHTFGYLRALKAWYAGDRATAREETEQAIRENTDNKRIAPEYLAFLALQLGDASEFRRLVGERVKTHRQAAAKEPKDPRMVIAWSAMQLCRMARREGLVVMEEGPYLPLRFLPEWSTP